MRHVTLFALLFASFTAAAGGAEKPKALRVLFLGDRGHHRPAERAKQLMPVMRERGINVTYTENVEALNAKTLASFDALIVYANIGKISPEQEQALLDYVAGGGGFVPLHCASFCFLNSDKYIALVGGQFRRHTTGTFRTQIVEPNHPLMKGFGGFESWDETYVHHRHNEKDRTVLSYRQEGDTREPWTWVRTHGKGRVFYTAWGHDARTWGHPGFQNLVERGIRWAAGADLSVVAAYADRPQMTSLRKDVKPFEYVKANVPYYPPGKRWGTLGKPNGKMQVPLSPAESMKHFVTPVDFEVKLFAAEPDIGGKPICMNWDERGRLWIAETFDYPNEKQPEGKGRDRIRILEDTNGDGRADKFTVFAEKLSIPTSITFYKGGVIVHQAPDTLYLKDTDGDDVADIRKVLFTGWSTGDTHAGPSNLHWGPDNWIWGMVGYAGFNGTIGGERHSFRTGFYRFKPDGSKFEFIRNTNNNSWGVSFSEEGIVWGSTANGNPSVYMPIANRYYEKVRGWSSSVLGRTAASAKFYPITGKIRQVDAHGSFTAGAGHAIYTARTYPRTYWNRTAFVNGPTGHLIGTFQIEPRGSDFVTRNSWNLLASDDEWSAPIMSEVGPDGHMWVIDWYNYIVQHNPVPAGFKRGKGNAYITKLRDKKHGRIYRVVYKGAKPQARFTLAGATPEKLVATLKHDNMRWRLHAQRLLVERGKLDVVPALLKLALDDSVDAIGLNVGVNHALWTLHGLGALSGSKGHSNAAAAAALRHRSAGARRVAVSVMPRTASSVEAILSAGLLTDKNAQVRLAAFLALADMPASQGAANAIAKAILAPANADDRWIPDAATSAAATHDLFFLQAVAAGKSSEMPARAQQTVAIVSEHYARGGPSKSVGSLVASLAASNQKTADAIVAGLAKGWPKATQATLTAENEKAMARLLTKLSPGAKGQFVKLASRWGSKGFEKYSAEIVKSLAEAMTSEKQSDAQRIAAARQLIEFRATDDKAVAQLIAAVTPQTPPAVARGIIDALALSEAPGTGKALVAAIGGLSPTARQAALRVLLLRAESSRALLDGIDKGRIQLAELSLDQKQALARNPNRQIAARARAILKRGGSLPSPDRQKVLAELLPLTKLTGDAKAGKLIYTKQCSKCHVHSGEGTKIGPDLTGMAVHPKHELLTHIIDPSRSVEGNYRQYSVVTIDGLTLTGLLASETKTTIELFDAEGKKHIVLRENIEVLIASRKSLMPDGFEKQVSKTDIVNLLEFLTQRGKFLPIPLDKAATVVSTKGMFFDDSGTLERLIFPNWKPKTFEGVPFVLVDPEGDRVANVVMLHGPNGTKPPKMPRSVSLPCNAPAKAIHFLSGVSGWGAKQPRKDGPVSMIVRLRYADGKIEDHPLRDGHHFADYIGPFEVPGSKLAFKLRGQQIRYLVIYPKRTAVIKSIDLVKGPDRSAPIVMAVTVEGAE